MQAPCYRPATDVVDAAFMKTTLPTFNSTRWRRGRTDIDNRLGSETTRTELGGRRPFGRVVHRVGFGASLLAAAVSFALASAPGGAGADLSLGTPMPGPGTPLPAVTGFHLPGCTGTSTTVQRLNFLIGGTPTYAMVALPAGTPKGLVMYGHGYSEWAFDVTTTEEIESFARDGAIAIAPEYRGTIDPPDTADQSSDSRGFPVANGALDMNAIAEAALKECPEKVAISSGGSEGGAISGLAVALNEIRPNGTPLFDYWVGISPLTDVIPDWVGASALASTDSYYSNVTADMDAECGGTPAAAPDAYIARSLIFQRAKLKASGLKGAVVLHSAADFDITPEQPALMVSALRQAGIPTEFGDRHNSISRRDRLLHRRCRRQGRSRSAGLQLSANPRRPHGTLFTRRRDFGGCSVARWQHHSESRGQSSGCTAGSQRVGNEGRVSQ